MRIQFSEGWELSFTHPGTGKKYTIPAAVPGNVEPDLMRAGILTEDPLPPDHILAAHWIDLTDFEYTTTFRFDGMPDGMKSAELVFEGIDTVADIFLNGELLIACDNMFIEHRTDVSGKLRNGENKLVIRITSALAAARKMPKPSPLEWVNIPERMPSVYLRKARHCWGWDNAPYRVTAGVWRPVYLEFQPACRFLSVYTVTDALYPERKQADFSFWYSLDIPELDLEPYRLHLALKRNGRTAGAWSFKLYHTSGWEKNLSLTEPELWYPNGFGDPALYDFELTLEKDGRVLAEHTHRFGLRIIRLERTETTTPEGNGEFQFYCNGEKIYIRGTNWKPLSPYHSETPQKMDRALKLVEECNCNMIRVWGGGIYEDDSFFDYCDEHGLLIWQDFMFACENPSNEDFFMKMVEKEAESVITRFRNHASLALWCGDNEVDDAFTWGSAMNRTQLPSQNRISRELLPRMVLKFDPARDYLPSSPYLADSIIQRKDRCPDSGIMMPNVPEQHLYQDCTYLPQGGYREIARMCAAHFVSETGPLIVNAMSEDMEIVKRELPRLKRLWNTDPASLPQVGSCVHQFDLYCAKWCQSARVVTRKMFGCDFTPEQPEKLIFAVNFYVADLFKSLIESWRMQKFRRTGIIWWSLLDMWPMAFNYSVVDSNFRKKLPFEFIRLAQQSFALMGKDPVFPQEHPELYAVNDTRKNCTGLYRVRTIEGNLIAEKKFESAKNGAIRLCELPMKPGEAVLLEWETTLGSGKNFYLCYGEPYDFEFCRKLAEQAKSF